MRPNPTPHRLTVPDATATDRWTVLIVADPDPLLLPRALQKFAVPAIELRAARYQAGSATLPARIEIEVTAARAWVELIAGKLRKLVAVRAIECRRVASDGPTFVTPPGFAS